ncbi:hypothetical protein HYW74_00670 [Candidatus Pacearchaeota archaeon]|nr:hypothetical protein [Candidatus Pacearchaeota archaeon]
MGLRIFQPSELDQIHTWECEDSEKLKSLERAVKEGRWDNIPPIWIEKPGFVKYILNQMILLNHPPYLSSKPFIIYNGHSRLFTARKYSLTLKAFIIGEKGTPRIPKEEKLRREREYISY